MGLSSKQQKHFLQKLGQYVVQLRTEQGIKQIDLASVLDIDVRILRRIEKGETNIQVLFLFELAEALDVEPISFLEL